MSTASGSGSSTTESRGTRGVNKTLMVLVSLALIGIVVTMFVGEQTFKQAGISTPVVVPFAWSLFVGVVFTTIGAAGGTLAGVGHISVLGMQNANDIKPMNQMTTLVSPFFALPSYLKQKRIVLSLGLLLGVGSILGSLLGSWFSASVLDALESYQPVFGAITLFVGFRTAYEITERYRRHKVALAAVSQRFEEAARSGDAPTQGVKNVEMTPKRFRISFFGEEFGFNPFWPVLAGVLIAFISSMLGVGGGFLLVPFMASVLGLPMFIVAGTALFTMIISSLVSIANYVQMGSNLDVPLLSIEIAGIIIGSMMGPILSKYIKEKWLRLFLTVILFYIGIGYLFGGWIESALGFAII